MDLGKGRRNLGPRHVLQHRLREHQIADPVRHRAQAGEAMLEVGGIGGRQQRADITGPCQTIEVYPRPFLLQQVDQAAIDTHVAAGVGAGIDQPASGCAVSLADHGGSERVPRPELEEGETRRGPAGGLKMGVEHTEGISRVVHFARREQAERLPRAPTQRQTCERELGRDLGPPRQPSADAREHRHQRVPLPNTSR